MVASFHSCGTSPVIHTATVMPWNARRISWELSESPSLSSSAGSSSGLIALPSAIDLRPFFVSFTTGRSSSDRAIGFGDKSSIIVRLRAAEVVLSKDAKHRLHLARMFSSFRSSFPSSSLIYCALSTFLPCDFYPPLRYPYQPLMSPAKVNFSSSQAYTSRYLSSAACMISLTFLHAFRNARKAEHRPMFRALPSGPLPSPSKLLQIRCALPYPRTTRYTGLSDLAWHYLLCGPQECVGEKGRLFADFLPNPKFCLREVAGYKLYQLFASVGVRRDCSSANTLPPCGGSLVSITSESSGESNSGAHDVVVGIHTQRWK